MKNTLNLILFAVCLWTVSLLQAQNLQKGDYGYLYCHMSGRGEWTAYALSRDGLHYHDLIGGDSIFSPAEKAGIEGGTRDAYICRKHDGSGYLMVTTDMCVRKSKVWNNYGINLLTSDDLIHWESKTFDFRKGAAIFSDPESPDTYRNYSTVNRVWAPQVIWDAGYRWPDGRKGGYFVYYSLWNKAEEKYDRMYYSYADETFTTLTKPRLLFDWGYATIDADINYLESDGLFHLMIKKEGGKPGLFTATAPALTGPWSEPVEDDYVDFEGNKKCEGVSAFRLVGDSTWHVGYIEYSSNPKRYRICKADKFLRNFHSPRDIVGVEAPQHGSFMRLTREEYERLEAWAARKSDLTGATTGEEVRGKYNFNPDWLLCVGDVPGAERTDFADAGWKRVTLPHAFNEDEAFRLHIEQLTDTVVWYRKHFRLPQGSRGKKVFLEFEGVRQAADFYLNGKHIGRHENGVMAVGLDVTPYIKYGGENVLALRIDNDWHYREQGTDTEYQWNNKNFNANYGGIPKNVWLHVTGKLYQTLPLYSNLGTTGVYVYADNIRVKSHRAVIHAESEVKNELKRAQHVLYRAELIDRDGKPVKTLEGSSMWVQPGETVTLKASAEVEGLHFWSWGYGYLYTVKSALWVDGRKVDEVAVRTGFRKTRFGDGKVWLNDRVIQLKGYAQRTSNEWPGVGMSVPAWLSDYSNGLMVEGNANLVRWMHVTPWKQDIESCDRVGLIQAMPAGDAEKDCTGRRWEQRKELMRDAIIYNRNNPSILFYECGNESISREHLLEMKALRDAYDPCGGRAVGSREMLDIRESEYGGEMLYINKSARHPMWAMEYSRDEGLRKYWDEYSYPFHREGAGPLYRGKDASSYNHNQDMLAVEGVRRWYDYWRERPGTGRRVSSGGVKIIFSDTNTHCRGEENYRRSGVTDAMRIPKDAFFAHQVMWDGWVDTERPRIHIVGHWNYEAGTVKPVYVVSSAEQVALFLNGKPLGSGERESHFLHTYKKVAFEPGKLEAVGYDAKGKEVCRAALQTAGEPVGIRLSMKQSPEGWKADGADMVLVQAEVVDEAGNCCPLANHLIHFELEGPAEWRGGIAQGEGNCVLSKDLPVECGVNRALIRSLTTAGEVRLTAKADGLRPAELKLSSAPVEVRDGWSRYIPGDRLQGWLSRGETPQTATYTEKAVDVAVLSATAGANNDKAACSYDDNELSEWRNDGKAATGWITYKLERAACIDEICLKLTGWRMRSYSLEIYAGRELVWSGDTEKSLGYIHLPVKPVRADEITIRLKGAGREEDAFGQIVEVAAPAAGELDLFKAKGGDKAGYELRIVEVEFKEKLE